MSANELLEKVKALPPRERRKFLRNVNEWEASLLSRKPNGKHPVRWADAAARRRKIFGSKVLPNLVLLAREEEPF